jgi:hypothetical protein
MASDNQAAYTELFGIMADAAPASFLADVVQVGEKELDDYGVTSSEARELRNLQNSDPTAFASEVQRYADKYASDKECLKDKKSTVPSYSAEVGKMLEAQERTPADGAWRARSEHAAPQTARASRSSDRDASCLLLRRHAA